MTARTPPAAAPAVPRPGRRLRNILSLNDFEAAAKSYLPRSIFAYVRSGVESEVTLRDNRAVFDDYHLVPRMLVGVRERTQHTTLFGESISL